MNDQNWTDEEIKLILDNRKKPILTLCRLLPNRTMNEIFAKRIELYQPPKRGRMTIWSDKEIEILKNNYENMGLKVAELLFDKNKAQILSMAHRLKINRGGVKLKWSNEEIGIIRKHYPLLGGKTADMLPGRTRKSIIGMATRLGIYREWPRNAMQGNQLLNLNYVEIKELDQLTFLNTIRDNYSKLNGDVTWGQIADLTGIRLSSIKKWRCKINAQPSSEHMRRLIFLELKYGINDR